MKFSVLFILIYLTWHARARLNPVEDTTKAASTALSDVLKAFFIAPEEPFDVFILGNETKSETSNILDDTLSKARCVTTIERITKLTSIKMKYNMTKSSIFLGSPNLQKLITRKFTFKNSFPRELKILIYTKNIKPFSVVNYLSDEGYRVKLDQFLYFLHEQEEKIDLFTFEWFTRHACNRQFKHILSTFTLKTLTWNRPLRNHRKFRNFHGCQIVAVQASAIRVRDDKITGMAFDILDAVGSRFNFTVYRQRGYFRGVKNSGLAYMNGFTLNPQVIISFKPIDNASFSTKAIADEKISIIINEGELYSSYEKLLFPFDAATWSLLIGTFCAAFGTIVIVNRLPKRIQFLVYGDTIYFPAFNVLGTFFGIGQTHLPSANFPRVILMLFIIFCLIFRTAYQGVFFEMMATDMRKPVPETIKELVEQNYTIYCANHSVPSRILNQTIAREYQLAHVVQLYDINNFRWIFEESSKRFAVIVESLQESWFSYLFKRRPRKLELPIITLFMAISTIMNNFMFPIIDEVVERTMPAGIPQHWNDFTNWDYLLRHIEMNDEDELVSLTLDDLGFGFILWLIACGVSFTAFSAELYMWRKIKKRWAKKWRIRDGKLRRKVHRKPRVILVREAEPQVEHNA